MNFLHIGDLHLGKNLGSFDLIEDQQYILKQIITLAKENRVDALLLAGDIYDKTIPSEKAVSLLDTFLQTLVKEDIKAFLVSGNHDSDVRLDFGNRLFETNGIYIAGRYQGGLTRISCEDSFGPLNVYLLPFIKASQVKSYYPDEDINSYDDAVRCVIEKADIDETQRNLLVAHQFVAGRNKKPILGGSENQATLQVGLVEQVFVDSFDVFDYVALGHIHHAQKIARKQVRYSGSPLVYSLSEVGQEKTVPLISVKEKGEVEVTLLPLKPLRKVLHLKGKLASLLAPQNILSPDAYVYVTLTDEEPVQNVMSILQQHYPRTLKVSYENSHTKALSLGEVEEFKRNDNDFPKLISDFYSMMYGCPISGEEMEIVQDVARKAGVMHETD